MNKRIYLILSILTFVLIGASSSPGHLVRLSIVNKSGRKIELSLTGRYLDEFYYLRVPEGDHLSPAEKEFTIVPDTYASNLYYYELWDPVYGNQCGTKGQTMDLTRNVRVTVLPCELTPANGGESPSIIKYGGHNRKAGR